MIRGRRQGGSSLAEVTVTTFVLTILMGAVFTMFQLGYRGFKTVTNRQNTHTQLAAVRAALQQDLQMSNYYGLSTVQSDLIKVGDKEVSRSALSAVALSDWNDESSFRNLSEFAATSALLGAPKWDRWIVYRVTHDPQGEMMRHVLIPPTNQNGAQLLRPPDQLSSMVNDPNKTRVGWPLAGTQQLATNVKNFDVVLDQDTRSVSISLTLESSESGLRNEPESVKANFYIKPHNTGAVD
jgi:hypothetical protein